MMDEPQTAQGSLFYEFSLGCCQPNGPAPVSLLLVPRSESDRALAMQAVGTTKSIALLTSFASLILAVAPADAAGANSIAAFVSEIYGPYFSTADPRYRPWRQDYEDRPIWSAQTSALFKTWRTLQKEADSINDQDGLCDCQARSDPFEVHVLSVERPDQDHASVQIKTENGITGPANLTLLLVRKNARWRLDDVYWAKRRAWLKPTLRSEIAAEQQP